MRILGTIVAWMILLSPLAAGAIVIRSALSGKRVKSALVLAIFVALFGGIFWMFIATGYGLQYGYSWLPWLPWVYTAIVVCGAAAMASLSISEWMIVLAALYMFRVLPYESKVNVEPPAQHTAIEQRPEP